MKCMKVLAAFLVGVLLAAADVHALTFGLDTAYVTPSVTPDGKLPWLTAAFEDVGPSAVRLTLDAANLSGTTQSISQWFFNFTDAISLARLSFAPISGEQGSIIRGRDLREAGGGQLFDIEFDFNTGQFAPGEKSVYQISSTDPTNFSISSQSFNFKSISASVQDANYYSAALVNGVGVDLKSWIAAPTSQEPGPGPGPGPVPEPATMLLFGFGLIGLAFSGRRNLLK